MPIHEEAFRRAQERAFSAFDCQLVRDGHDHKAAYERYERALIAAYLGDPDILEIASDHADETLDIDEADLQAITILQAIGAGVAP